MSHQINIQVIFYSMYGHVHQLAEAVTEGAKGVDGVAVKLLRVPELIPDAVLEKSGAKKAQEKYSHIPIAKVEELPEADAIIFGTPTRFGNMCAQMRNFLDQTGGLWFKGVFVGKVGSVFCSTSTQHGGQETTITSFHTNLLHYGMVIVGVPYAIPELMTMKEISGGSPYGASTIADGDNSRNPSETELRIAKFQGEHVAKLTKMLRGKA